MENLQFLPGKPLPLGATVLPDGVNFSVFSRNGTGVVLELFEDAADGEPSVSYTLDYMVNKTGDVWHVFVKGLGKNALYLYRVDGPFYPNEGMRFNANKYLLDPYAKAVSGPSLFASLRKGAWRTPDFDPDLIYNYHRSAEGFPKCVVIDNTEFDWQGDVPLNYPLRSVIIYEMHVRGFTSHPSGSFSSPGTYRGVIEAIPHLKELGVTSVELLPVNEFDENECDRKNPRTGKLLKNYWGYSTIAFFAPKMTYAERYGGSSHVNEFKEMVRELHRAGIEVILDIVFNHTAEGNERGVTISFRGFDNSVYYMLEDNKRYYRNFAGCGNTMNCNHPVCRTFILDCLRYWVCEMHVDGFRFDLGSILARGRTGEILDNPPLLENIAEDPVLSKTKIIAEAWDAGGAYQVGAFPGGRWAEWNDRFRDDVRRFWRGDNGAVFQFATRMAGSSDLYMQSGRKPYHSINFVTCHDGFTMNDLVSYNGKHNDENGESNRDGSDNNISFNYGFEGPVENPGIERIRERQIKNFMCSLLLAIGTPMILMGDEIRRTQGGNNNAYCQDSEVSWMDWSLKEKNKGLFSFVRRLIAFRKRHPAFTRTDFFKGKNLNVRGASDITWFSYDGTLEDWESPDNFIAYLLMGNSAVTMAEFDDSDIFIMYNATTKDITATLPPASEGKAWFRIIDTSRPSPDDILEENNAECLQNQKKYVILSRSTVVFISKIQVK